MNGRRPRSLLFGTLLLSACYVQPAQQPAPMGPPPPSGAFGATQGGAGYVAGNGAIEAGCSYAGTNLPGDIGATFQVGCPPGCESAGGGLWGADVYTADSVICKAGIHAGVISPAGGLVTVRLEPGRPAYRGGFRNGIQSSDYGQYPKSYAIYPGGGEVAGSQPPTYAPPPQPSYQPPPPPVYSPPPPPPPPAPVAYPAPGTPQVIEAGCSYNGTQIRGAPGASVLVSCPPGCLAAGAVWGTDTYTGDSAICKAGIHAGLVTDQAGGRIWVTIDPGLPAYRGSHRNRVRSSDYGNYPSSYHVSPAR